MERGQASFGLISRHMKSPLQSDKIKLQLDGGFNKQTKISLKRQRVVYNHSVVYNEERGEENNWRRAEQRDAITAERERKPDRESGQWS